LGYGVYITHDNIQPQAGIAETLNTTLATYGMTSTGKEILATYSDPVGWKDRVKASGAGAVFIAVTSFNNVGGPMIQAMRSDPDTAMVKIFLQPQLGQNT